jgi:hypothetical protein
MTKINRWFATAAMVGTLCSGASLGLAQDNNERGNDAGGQNSAQDSGGRGGRGGRFNGGNFDPAQFQQQMMERTRESLEVKDDAEWKAIEGLVQKVMDTRREMFSSGMGRMFGGRRGGGGQGGDQAGRRGGFGQPSPEAEALQRAIDSKASKAELKAALAKYQESRKAKQAELEKAQEELRKVLTARQEAIATVNGLL